MFVAFYATTHFIFNTNGMRYAMTSESNKYIYSFNDRKSHLTIIVNKTNLILNVILRIYYHNLFLHSFTKIFNQILYVDIKRIPIYKFRNITS